MRLARRAAPAIDTAPADRLAFADRYARIDRLLNGALAFWKGAVDWDGGGFFGLIDLHGRPREDAEKDMIQQVRHLWTFPAVYRFEDASDEIADICHHQFRFVRDKLFIPDRAEFHRSVTANGEPAAEGMHHYPMAFAVHGLASYALTFRESDAGAEALGMALAVLDGMMARSYDESYGFDESVYPAHWLREGKEINTQMHLLEAITELLLAVRAHHHPAEPEIESLLHHQLDLIWRSGIAERNGRYFCSRAYSAEWDVLNDWEVDYGHDIEVVHLTMAAAQALGRQSETDLAERVIRLGASVTDAAYDRRRGRWYYSGNPLTGRVSQRVANIWTHFEALNGLAVLFDLTGDASFLARFDRVLDWIGSRQLNAEVGEWYYNVNGRGRPVSRDVFNGDCGWMTFAWKSSYHSLRALMNLKKWSRRRERQPESEPALRQGAQRPT